MTTSAFDLCAIYQTLLESKCSATSSKSPIFSDACKQFTKLAKATGPENISPERPRPSLLAPGSVFSPSRITLENKGKIRPQPDRENAFARASGGEEGPDIQPSLPINKLI